MKALGIVATACISLLCAHSVMAKKKGTVTPQQVATALEKAKFIEKKLMISEFQIDFRKMCKKGSVFSSNKTWRSDQGSACNDPKVAALAIVHCPKIMQDFETSYCWNKAVNLLSKAESTTQSILDNNKKELRGLPTGNNPPPPSDLPPPLPY